MSNLTDRDIRLLRWIAGEDVPDMRWGAATSVALETLQGSGYVTRDAVRLHLTEKGRALMDDISREDLGP